MADDELWEEVRKSGETSWAHISSFLNDVRDLPSFVRFIDALWKDREDADRKEALQPSGPDISWNGWENNSIATFLESAVACVEDNRRHAPGFLADENPWKAAARILYAGKYYE
ncbi:hypothetical protein FJV80_11520 [Mesorhizobium sp. WSM4310]|uniref:DUF7660 family protein n=1 Tax=Mesorhizobium sp. WSM4310 TaxID=2589883 RepID=UPI00115EE474|nr:hypothetical protein [Mesorhizobium sp. WSM4310]TRC88897.1 hypothetical protein FJV80_11520 [Mesorhizobium sp. WSM4310]